MAEGAVRLSKVYPDGRRQVLGFTLPGDLIGTWLSDIVPYSVGALTPALACLVPRSDFLKRILDDPHLMRRVHECAMQMLRFSQEHACVLGRGLAEEKVAWFLVRWHEQWEEHNGKSDMVPLPMTRQDIADYLGLTIETVSRTVMRLQRQGILRSYRDRVQILDADRLRSLALMSRIPDQNA